MTANFKAAFENTDWGSIPLTSFPNGIEGDYWPPLGQVFHAFTLVKKTDIKQVILGQDPYPSPIATGVAFGVSNDTKNIPLSLKPLLDAIYPNNLQQDKTLESWAIKYGVLMLNCALTIPQGTGKSCSGKHLAHWKQFTSDLIEHLAGTKPDIKWLAVGRAAQKILEKSLVEDFEHCYHPAARIAHNDKRSFKYFCEKKLNEFIGQGNEAGEMPIHHRLGSLCHETQPSVR